MGPLDDLTGKTVWLNGVPLPDRKNLKITAPGAIASDSETDKATLLEFAGSQRYSTSHEIARMLTAPTKKYHLFVVGDSTQTQMQTYALTNCPEIAWTGTLATYATGLAGSGAHAATATTGGFNDTAWASPKISVGGKAVWFGTIPSVEVEFLGGAEAGSGATLMRTQYSDMITQTACPLLWTGLSGKGAAVRGLVYKYSGGMSGNPGIRISYRHGVSNNFADAGNFQGGFLNYTRQEAGLAELRAEVAAGYAWGTYGSPVLEVVAAVSGTTVNTEKLAVTSLWIEGDGPGVIYFPLSCGGWSIEGWLNTAEIPMRFWTELIPAIAANPIFFIDIGINNPAGNTQAEHEEKLEKLIARVRTAFPFAPIILGTEHEYSTSGSSPYCRLATIAVAARTPGCLLLDTMAEMGTYADGVTADYYNDTVHYNATGLAAYWAKLGDMLAAA